MWLALRTATDVAWRRPSAPIRRMYAQGIIRMPADPHGAPLIAPMPVRGPASGSSG